MQKFDKRLQDKRGRNFKITSSQQFQTNRYSLQASINLDEKIPAGIIIGFNGNIEDIPSEWELISPSSYSYELDGQVITKTDLKSHRIKAREEAFIPIGGCLHYKGMHFNVPQNWEIISGVHYACRDYMIKKIKA